ncbi:MAG: hypothetical protein ACYTEK_07115 [Planctomycetota bacterium]|jgi:hypothetical protein
MWRTQYGDRALQGAEAIVFAEALWSLLDEATIGTLDDYEFGIEVFDDLTFGQRIATLSIIANGLLRKDTPPVRLTAVLEGAIAAVFQHIQNQITFEIDTPEFGTGWRELVIAARRQTEGDDSERAEIPGPTCEDLDEWDLQMQELSGGVLWDGDYEDAQLYIDFSPEKSKELRGLMGIPKDYFMAIADDLTDEEAQARIKQLKKLCDSVINPS